MLVSYSKTTERAIDADKLTPEDLYQYVTDHWDDLQKPDYYFGAWADGGKIYLDVSIITRDEQQAIKIAQENDQLAYFKFKDLTSVNTPKRNGQSDAAPVQIKRFLVKPSLDNILKLHKALTGRDATLQQIATLKARISEKGQN